MTRTVGLWVSVALLLGVALGAIPTFLAFHGSKSSPKSGQAIPVYQPSPVVPRRLRPECPRNKLLNTSLASPPQCFLHPDQPHPILVTSH
jgi:hypothetical protein